MRSAIVMAAIVFCAALCTPSAAVAAPEPQSGNSSQMPVGMGRKKPPPPQDQPQEEQSKQGNAGQQQPPPPKKKKDDRR
ncbi:hypothetical protein DFR29_116111 [Tahibacter aquaticus]|uniref:Secreted protein n=1 Tax=Tahibacter aquaticus TaxID=520092 RepID=A0A4R6YNX9_9GAMM|nr:hypothetical protein [Tahibacter aquaticus]TDR39409.1 hypothetical protein DFR29_116111 [Tahibacter aquaticus]